MSKEIRVLITLQSKFVSTNELYKARVSYSFGHPKATVYKNPRAAQVESEVRCQLIAVDFSEYLDWLRNTEQFDISFKFIFKRSNTHFDTSNYIKNLEDIWTRFVRDDLGIDNYDDSKHIRVFGEKSIIPGATSEYALLVLKESKANIRYDIDPKPEKIWISDMTAEEITAFLPPLPKTLKKKDRYQVQAEYDAADTKVYILQPTNFIALDSTIIAKIYKDAIEAVYQNSGFVLVGVIGDENSWQPNDWKSLMWLSDEIQKLEKDYRGVKMGWIPDKKSILEWMK